MRSWPWESTPRPVGDALDESLTILRALLDSGEVTFVGEHFELDSVRISWTAGAAWSNPGRRTVGGGAPPNGTIWRRLAGVRLLAGPLRFSNGRNPDRSRAVRSRPDTQFEHGLVVWCGFSDDDRPSRLCTRSSRSTSSRSSGSPNTASTECPSRSPNNPRPTPTPAVDGSASSRRPLAATRDQKCQQTARELRQIVGG